MDNDEIVIIKDQLICQYCGKFCNEPAECKSCYFTYCKKCANNIDVCLSEECQKMKKKIEIKSNEAIIRMIRNNEFPPICSYCNKQFNNYFDYEKHLEFCSHHFYICKICKNQFSDQKKFVNHLLSQHFDQVYKELNEN